MITEDKVKLILAALTEAVNERLATEDRTRFADAMRLCQEAQSVLRLAGKRVKDFRANEYQANGFNVQGVMAQGGLADVEGEVDDGYVAPRAYQGPLDQAGMMRELVMAITPHFEAMRRQLGAKERLDLTGQLRDLLAIRDQLAGSELEEDVAHRASIGQQINDLMKRLEAKHDDVVPTDAVRRHPAGVQGPEGDQGHLREAVPPGDGGDEGPPGEGGEEGLGDDGVALVRACGPLPG